jgi:hypothetical protein
MKKAILVVLVFIKISCFGQIKTQEGFLKDIETNQPLAYVNVGVVGKNIGTVSDVNGKFQLVLDNQLDNEILKISMIGYVNQSFKVKDFKDIITKNNIIYLEKSIASLKEVVIKNKKLKTRILGNILDKKTVSAGFVNNILGNEIGIIIKIKKKPTFIESFNAMVDYNNYGNFKFRINFYALKDGLPDNSILQENIIANSSIKKGKLSIDLSEYNIVVEQDIFVSIELIEGLGEGGLHFLADYSGAPIITRAASQGKWNKIEDLSFGFNLTCKY